MKKLLFALVCCAINSGSLLIGAMQTSSAFFYQVSHSTPKLSLAPTERFFDSTPAPQRAASDQQAFFLQTTAKTLELLSDDLEAEIIGKLLDSGFEHLRFLLANASPQVQEKIATNALLSIEEIARIFRENSENLENYDIVTSDDNDDSEDSIDENDIVTSEEDVTTLASDTDDQNTQEPVIDSDEDFSSSGVSGAIFIPQDCLECMDGTDENLVSLDDSNTDGGADADDENWDMPDDLDMAETRDTDNFQTSFDLDIDETMTLIKTGLFRLAKLIVIRSQYTHIPPIHVYKVLEAVMNYPATHGIFSDSFMQEDPIGRAISFVTSAEMALLEVLTEVNKENREILEKIGAKIAKDDPSYYDISSWLEAMNAPVCDRNPGTKSR